MWIWFGLAVLALIGEIANGTTFYLLLVAVGLAAGGVAALAGWNIEAQLLICCGVALAGLFILRRTGVLKKREVDATRNADVNLDIGQVLRVDAWDAGGTARAQYRGASWQVELAPGYPPQGGEFVITAVRGSSLIVAPRPSVARS